MNKTAAAVAVFVCALIAALYSADAKADGVRLSLGKTFRTSDVTAGEVSYEMNDWELAATQLGQGETNKGRRDEAINLYSLSKMVRPGWCVGSVCGYFRIGVAHTPDALLIGDTNYRNGLGIETRVFQVEYFHYSSAGIHKPNTGIDGLMLRLKL
ncbi:MAG: hypothetical protein CMN85_10695 [Spongiibacteraceae bacterium]|nr:hypothetical protein [Spongiibacteraceae bacterium]|tara:strand:+ start:32484 stop:32948 length:465 start_codon:yes stop_codon:yes gene_type:complete